MDDGDDGVQAWLHNQAKEAHHLHSSTKPPTNVRDRQGAMRGRRSVDDGRLRKDVIADPSQLRLQAFAERDSHHRLLRH